VALSLAQVDIWEGAACPRTGELTGLASRSHASQVALFPPRPPLVFTAAMIKCLIFAAPLICAATPTPLQALLDAAINAGSTSLTLPPNATFQQGSAPLLFTATNFLLDANGARIVFSPGAGVVIERSANVEVRNATVAYDPPAFTQGAVIGFDASALTIDVQLDAGFASPQAAFFTTVEIKMQFFDNTTRERSLPQSGCCLVSVVGPAEPGAYRFKLDAGGCKCVVPPLPVLATVSPRVNGFDYQIPGGYVGGAWWVFNSSRVTTRAVTLLGSGNFAFSEWGGDGGHLYDGIVLTRDEMKGHLLSSNTDGFHSFAVGQGPTVTNASLSWMGDDVFNFHNRVGIVLSTETAPNGALSAVIIDVGDTPTPRLDPASPSRALAFARASDVLKISSPAGTPRGGAPEGAFTLTLPLSWSANASTVAAARAAIAARPGVAVDPRGIGAWEAVFDAPGTDVAVGDVVQFDRYAGMKGLVRDSVFTDAYDTCFRLQSRGALLINNTWARTGGGIEIGYDPQWLEGASDIANINIDGNTFRAVGYPPKTTIDEVISVQKTALNVSQADNVVLPE
jgi:hypothetical protein